jgi:hypothetical protein
MSRRSLLATLSVGLVVGGAVGYFVGRQPVAGLGLPPVVLVVNPPPVVDSRPAVAEQSVGEPVDYDWSAIKPSLGMTPTLAAKGMNRAEAVAVLNAEGFTTPDVASVVGATATFASPSWHVRRPWMGGYHFVTVTFAGGKVAEVHEFWNDP